MTTSGWIGVDLDGTLAEFKGWLPGGGIGKPIPKMVEKVQELISRGVTVKIFTSRVAVTGEYSPESNRQANVEFAVEQIKLIHEWCFLHIGYELDCTATKDFACVEIWDDRARQVVMNTGEFLDEHYARSS